MLSEKHARTALKNLKPRWPEIEVKLARKRRELAALIEADDPLHSPVNLFFPLDCEKHEETHTRAIAYLLNPRETHGFGSAILSSLLEFIGQREAVKCLGGTISVSPEHLVEDDAAKHRFDIRAEIKRGTSTFLIIIENKIGAPISQEQLTRYEKNARARAKAKKATPILILLSTKKQPKNSKPSRWIRLHYLELASILRRAWRENKKAPGRNWLALYIASILHGVLELGQDPHRIEPADLDAYSGAVHGK